MNEEVKINCKEITTKMFKVLGLLVELGTAIEKPKVYLDASPSIRKPSNSVPYNSPVIYYSILNCFFLSNTLQYHS